MEVSKIYDNALDLFNFLGRSPTAYEVACFTEKILKEKEALLEIYKNKADDKPASEHVGMTTGELVSRILKVERELKELKSTKPELHKGLKSTKPELHIDSMNDVETRRYKEWTEKHYQKCRPTGGWTVQYKYTGIGNGVSVICPKCKAIEDLTDMSSW